MIIQQVHIKTYLFHSSLIIFYLLAGSWSAVFFALAPYNRFKRGDNALKYLAIFHSYILFTYGFAIIGTAPTFGMTSNCNADAVVFLFRPFSALHAGRIFGGVVLCLVFVIYTSLVVNDYRRHMPRRGKPRLHPESPGDVEDLKDDIQAQENARPRARSAPAVDQAIATLVGSDVRNPWERAPGYDVGLDGRMLITLSIIAVIWALVVMNTELLIRSNHFQSIGTDSSQWQFGQVQ